MLPGSLPQAATVCRQEAFDYHYGAIPRELVKDRPLGVVVTGQAVLTQRGPACVVGRPGYHKNPVLSVLTAMFVHAGWLHLLGNMLFLLIFGNNIEDRFRKIPYLIFYVACGYVAAYGFAFVHPGSVEPLIGASGAIAGVLGAYLALYPRARVWSLVPFLFFIPAEDPRLAGARAVVRAPVGPTRSAGSAAGGAVGLRGTRVRFRRGPAGRPRRPRGQFRGRVRARTLGFPRGRGRGAV